MQWRAGEKSSGLQIEDNGTLCTALPVNDCLATCDTLAHTALCMGALGTLKLWTVEVPHVPIGHWHIEADTLAHTALCMGALGKLPDVHNWALAHWHNTGTLVPRYTWDLLQKKLILTRTLKRH